MRSKSRGAVAASVLAIAVIGVAGSVTAVHLMSARPLSAARAALPRPAGTAATARVPDVSGSAQGTTNTAGTGQEPGTGETGTPGTRAPGAPGGGTAGTATTAPAAGSTAPGSTAPGSTRLPASAGQGRPGPLPAGVLPLDGAVPGARRELRALAAARAPDTRLPHSPRLLSAAGKFPAGQSEVPGTAATPAGTAALPGVDVASFQHPVTKQYPNGTPITWTSVAAAGYGFAAIKATEGDYYVNPWAVSDTAAAKAAGLKIAPYHFAIPNVSGGAQQARFALEYSGYATGAQMLPLMLDIEYDPYARSDHTNECYGLTPKRMNGWISAFVSTVAQLTGQYPVIYSTAGWWNACTGGSTAFTADPLWVAAYGAASPAVPAAWPAWTFWQYTSGGTVPGIATSGGTDLSSLNPQLAVLIDPGIQASRSWTRVALQVGSLTAAAAGPLTWSASGLPRGLTLGADGLISGTVASAGASLVPAAYQVVLTARNTAGATATVTFGWHVTSSCARYLPSGHCPAPVR